MEGLTLEIYAALLTPMHADGSIDHDTLASHAEALLDVGVDGLAAMGTMGEFPDLSRDERRRAGETVMSVARPRDVPVILGVGAAGTREACLLAHDAAEIGASELMALPPFYWKLSTPQMIRHYGEIGRAADGVSIQVYDLPVFAGTSVTGEMLQAIAGEVDAVGGAKLSDSELGKIQDAVAIKERRPEFRVMIGHRDLLMAGMSAGADGAIAELANIAPSAHIGLRDAIERRDYETACRYQHVIAQLGNLSRLATPPMLPLKVATSASMTPIRHVVRTEVEDHDAVVQGAEKLTMQLFADYPDQLGALRDA